MTTEDLINGLKHAADDHPCCHMTIAVAIARLEVEIATAKRWEETAREIAKEKEGIERKLQKESARLDALEKLVNFGVWHGAWAEHVEGKAGKPIVEINEMCDDGQEVVSRLAIGETLREAIDNILSNTKASCSGPESAATNEEKL